MTGSDRDKKITTISNELEELEFNLKFCRDALKKIKRTGKPLPDILEQSEEYKGTVHTIEDFSLDINYLCDCLENVK